MLKVNSISSHKKQFIYVQPEIERDFFSAETKLNELIKKYDTIIEVIIQEYRKFETIDSTKLRKTYSDIDFLFANKHIRKKLLYNQILDKQLQLVNEIKTLVYVIESVPRSIQIERILQMQEKIAEKQKKGISICFYNKFYYEISCCLFILRKLIYGHKYKDKKPELAMFRMGKSILMLKDMNTMHNCQTK